jgi:hypothetical protein
VRPQALRLRPNIESFELGILRDSQPASKPNLAGFPATVNGVRY